jgi:hypothetical protein
LRVCILGINIDGVNDETLYLQFWHKYLKKIQFNKSQRIIKFYKDVLIKSWQSKININTEKAVYINCKARRTISFKLSWWNPVYDLVFSFADFLSWWNLVSCIRKLVPRTSKTLSLLVGICIVLCKCVFW